MVFVQKVLVRGLHPGQQIRDDFYSGLGRQRKGDFPMGQAGPAKEKRVYKWLGSATKKGKRITLRVSSGRQNKDEVFKPTDKS